MQMIFFSQTLYFIQNIFDFPTRWKTPSGRKPDRGDVGRIRVQESDSEGGYPSKPSMHAHVWNDVSTNF